MESFAAEVHPRQIPTERRRGVRRHCGHQLRRGMVPIELLTTRDQTQHLVEGAETRATSAAIAIGTLQLNRPSHRLDRAPDVRLHLEVPCTPWTRDRGALTFPGMSLLNNRLGDAPGEWLASVPYRRGSL